MARGRKPKPTVLKLVTGNPGHRPINLAEPKPRHERTSAPAHVTDGARETWGYVTAILDDMGLLTKADSLALEALCEALNDLRDARAALARPIIGRRTDKETGLEIEWVIAEAGERRYVSFGKDGVMVRPRPEMAMIADADRRIKAWLAEFGLTPSARSRVKTEAQAEEDPSACYFG
jgi:P27 family predicted phage terminase small subunit